jgi:hypothetical protein
VLTQPDKVQETMHAGPKAPDDDGRTPSTDPPGPPADPPDSPETTPGEAPAPTADRRPARRRRSEALEAELAMLESLGGDPPAKARPPPTDPADPGSDDEDTTTP